jgi:hypothetical protein
MTTTPVYGMIHLLSVITEDIIDTWEDREPTNTIHVFTHVLPSDEHGQMILIHGAWWE